jgi:chromosomal replication initiation ATPase DnaA
MQTANNAALDPSRPILTTFDRITREVSIRHQILPREILRPSKQRTLVAARDELVWRLLRETKMSKAGIARRLGQHHTSVVAAARRVALRYGAPR